MKTLNLIFTGAIISILSATTIFAAEATFSGTVADKNEISIANQNTTLALSSSGANIKAFDISINNNNATGFKLTFHSNSQGQLRHTSAYVDGSKPGAYLDYAVSVANPTGTLGVSKDTNSAMAFDLGSGDAEINYNLNPLQASMGASWDVNISWPEKSALFEGTFQDTIQVTIADI